MSCTIEKALADAKALVERLRDHDDAAESLIEQTTALSKRVEAMKQYQEEIQELNEVARHRPRSTLVMGIQQENRQIRELQQENKELRTSLEEHQSALELIMSKYREQVFRLLMASKKDDPGIIMKLKEQHSKIDMVHRNSCEGFFLDASRHILEAPQHGLERRHLEANQNELQAHVDQITEMAAVMRKAIEIDEQQGCKEQERIFQLEQENKGLREILQITRESFLNLRKDDASESTSLSALVTNSDLSLRKSCVAFCAVTRMGPEVSGCVNIKPNFSQPFPSGMYRDTGKETAAECITSGHKLDPSHSQKGDAEPQSEQRVFKVLLSTAVSEVLLAS